MAGFDLSSLSIDPEAQKTTYTVINPMTDEPLCDEDGNEVTLELWGPDSSALKAVEKKFRKTTEDKAFKKSRKGGSVLEYAIDLQRQKAIASVADWDNVGWEGEVLECTPKNVEMVFDKLPWIEEQVKILISDRVNFMSG